VAELPLVLLGATPRLLALNEWIGLPSGTSDLDIEEEPTNIKPQRSRPRP